MRESENSSQAGSEPPQSCSEKGLRFGDLEYIYAEESSADLRSKVGCLKKLKSRSRAKLNYAFLEMFRKMKAGNRWFSNSAYLDFFLGDQDLDESLTQMGWLKDRDVTVIPSYSNKSSQGEGDIVNAYGEISRSFTFASDHRNLISFVLLKPKLLIDDITFIKYATHPETLTEEEQEELERFHSRFVALCRLAYDLDLRVVVDADTYLCQNVIDRYTDEVMLLFNKHKPVVYAGLDVYRRDRVDRLEALIRFSKENDLFAGVALSEGLYNEEERAFASKNGYPQLPPEKPSEPERLYSEAVEKTLQNLQDISLCAVTHRADICEKIVRFMDVNDIETDDARIFFAQNMGVSDALSFALSREGYNVSKVFPYGEPHETVFELFLRHINNRKCRQIAQEEYNAVKKALKQR